MDKAHNNATTLWIKKIRNTLDKEIVWLINKTSIIIINSLDILKNFLWDVHKNFIIIKDY